MIRFHLNNLIHSLKVFRFRFIGLWSLRSIWFQSQKGLVTYQWKNNLIVQTQNFGDIPFDIEKYYPKTNFLFC